MLLLRRFVKEVSRLSFDILIFILKVLIIKFQVREQKFKIFMEDYPQAKNEDEARKRHEEIKLNADLFQCAKDQTAFLNIFFGRMWHDLHSNKDFIEFIREKLTRKLLKIKVKNGQFLKIF